MATKWISPTWRMPEESNQNKVDNYSLEFNGTDDEIDCGNSDAINITGPISISVWFNADNTDGARGIVCKNDAAAQQTYAQYFFDLLSNEIRWRAGKNTVSYGINTGQWYHAVGVYDGSDITLYIDGTSVATDSAFSTSYASSQPLYIGRRLNQDYFEGEIGQVAIYDSALLASQVSDLWNSGTPVNPMALTPLPTAYYPLGGSSTGSSSTLTTPNESVPSATVFDFVSSSNQYIDVGNSNFPTGNSSRTMAAWIKADSSGQNNEQGIFRYGTKATRQLFMMSLAATLGRLRVSTYGDDKTYSTSDLRDDKWHHVALTYDGTSIVAYLDGANVGVETNTLVNTTNNSPAIGNWNNAGFTFNGNISNVQLWSSKLEPSEITTLYNNGVPFTGTQPQVANLKGWWKMNVDTSTWNGTDWIIGEAQANYTSALDFDGTNDDVTISNVNLGTTHTISFWMKSDGTDRLDMFCNSYGQSRIYGPNVNGSLFYNANGANQYVIWNGQQGLNDNNWHHMCFVRNGTSVDFYADSVLQTVAATAITATDEYQFTNFMHPPATSRYTKGTISNLAVFTTALDLAAVQALYNNGTPQTSPSFSPTGWWKLNNTTTGIQDSAGSNNGTNNGATVTDIQVSTLNGISSGMTTANLVNSDLTRSIPYSSYSMEFDGTDDYILTGSAIDLGTSCSISFWYSGATSGRNGSVVGGRSFAEGGVSSNYQTIFLSSGTYFAFYQSNSATPKTFIYGSSPMNSSDWFHAVIVRDGANLNLYLNGADTSTSYTDLDATAPTYVRNIATNGENQTGSQTITGKISNVSLYNSALTEDQILTIYNGGVPNDISSLSPVSWWSLAGDSYFNGNDWICPDLGSGNNNGTSSGMGGTGLVGDGPGSTANGIATSMDIPANLKGNAPNSSKNAFSINMNSADRVEDVPA